MALEQRFNHPVIDRQFWLAEALIRLKQYHWSQIDLVAEQATDEDIDAFVRIIAALNGCD